MLRLPRSISLKAPKLFFMSGALLLALPGWAEQGTPKAPDIIPDNVTVMAIKTTSPHNPSVLFYLRRPEGFRMGDKGLLHRLLFICPYLNASGLKQVQGEMGCKDLIAEADKRGWFVLSATFHMDKNAAHDRKTAYYYPEVFSGKAVVEALDRVAKVYPVDGRRILMQGLSGGAQFVHRFALWAPERVVAVAVNSSSWFDVPKEHARQVAWLVTIGDSDPSFAHTLAFVDQLHKTGALPIFRSYMGMVHEGDRRVSKLDVEFLSYYDELTRAQLGKPSLQGAPLALVATNMPYIGDAQEWKFLPNTAANRARIPAEEAIFLPSQPLAKLWGKVDTGKD